MAFFDRILKFKPDGKEARDLRGAVRHTVGEKFPVKVTLSLVGRDEEGKPLGNLLKHSRAWGGRLINLSETGASVGISPAALAVRGDPSRVQFKLGDEALDLPCKIAHFRCYTQYANCGIAFEFATAAQQAGLRQLLEPVAIGASLEAFDPARIRQDLAGYVQERYTGHKHTRLSVWRDAHTQAIEQFDFRMNDYGVRWTAGMPELESYGCVGEATERSRTNAPVTVTLTEAQQIEVRWLFCLAVPNLAKAVRPDVRQFLTELVA